LVYWSVCCIFGRLLNQIDKTMKNRSVSEAVVHLTWRSIIFFILFMITGNSLKSQEYFNVRAGFEGGTLARETNYDVLVEEDGYITMGFFTDDDSYDYYFGLLKLDSEGYPVFTKNFLHDTLLHYKIGPSQGSLIRLNSSEYFNIGHRSKYDSINQVFNSSAVLLKFDNEFNIISQHIYGDEFPPIDTNFLFQNLILTPQLEFVVTGYISIPGTGTRSLLWKLDMEGNVIWKRYFQDGPNNNGIRVIQTTDGGFALSCFKWVTQARTSHNYLIKTDSEGNQQWRKYIGGMWADGRLYITLAPDNTIFGAYHYSDSLTPGYDSFNRFAVIKFDLAGNRLFEKFYGTSKKWFQVTSSTIDSHGNLVATAIEPLGSRPFLGSMFKVDLLGDLLWYRQYRKLDGDRSGDALRGVCPTTDGGYVAVGNLYPQIPDVGSQDVWVIKVDSMGCINFDDCWVGEKELPMPHNETEMLRVHPNPAKDKIQLNFGSDELHLPKTLHLYDGFGRLQRTVELTPGQEEANISGLPPGLYVGKVIIEGRHRASVKVLVQ